MAPGPVVDTVTAQEFLREVTAKVAPEELAVVAADLERKSTRMRELVGDDPAAMDRDALRGVLRQCFSTRRHADRILTSVGVPRLAGAVAELLHGPAGLASRFDAFTEVIAAAPEGVVDLPGELLHFTQPDRYWLLTRWVWDPETETGALRLVTMDEVDLYGTTRGETYLRVGQALAFVEETGKAAGFTGMGPGLFGADVFLASVYAIYLHTVLGMRMTQEFTRLAPPVGELVRRLLGVYHRED